MTTPAPQSNLPTLWLPWPFPPVLLAVVPGSGPARGGSPVTLTGLGLSQATQVRFGTAPATILGTDFLGLSLRVLAPAGSGTVAVTVVTPNGTATAPGGFTYIGTPPPPPPPPPPVVTGIAPASGFAGTPFTITGLNLAGTTVTFGGIPAVLTAVTPNTISGIIPAGVPGTVPVLVTTSGGTAAVPGGFTYATPPPPPPVVTGFTPARGPATGGTSFTITGLNLTGAIVTFGGISATITSGTSTTITGITPPHAAGNVSVRVATTGGSATVPGGFTYVPAPIISTINPDSGPDTGGTTVTITGTHLTGTTAVTFGGTLATSFTVNSDTQITAVTPAHTAATVTVTVTTPGGTSNGVLYTYLPTPALTAIVPDSGPETGGNTVTLTGTNFTGATAVHFGATPATSFTVVSGTQITAVAPAGTGTVDVTVTNANGTSNPLPYTYVPAPVLTTMTPAEGPETGGTIIITGTNLTGTTDVSFGGTPAASFTVNSNTQITAVSPAGTGTVNVTVTTIGGTSNGLPYTYVPAPTLASVVPDSGPATGGNTVTLTGTGFDSPPLVVFGVTLVPSFTVVSDTEIAAVVPAGTGTVDVTVITPGGTSNGVPYSYV